VNFKSVSTIGLESSPVAETLVGLRANEARYFSTKFGHTFTVEPASNAGSMIEYVNKILKEERDIGIVSIVSDLPAERRGENCEIVDDGALEEEDPERLEIPTQLRFPRTKNRRGQCRIHQALFRCGAQAGARAERRSPRLLWLDDEHPLEQPHIGADRLGVDGRSHGANICCERPVRDIGWTERAIATISLRITSGLRRRSASRWMSVRVTSST